MSRNSPLPGWIALAGAVAIGAMTAVQARINGVLGVRLDDGIIAGLVSFAVGLIILSVTVSTTRSGRAGLKRLAVGIRSRTVPFWMLLGGACGALTVTTQGLVAGVLGVSLFTVGVVAGQTLHGLLLDRLGVGPSGVVAVAAGAVGGGAPGAVGGGVPRGGGLLGSAPEFALPLSSTLGAGGPVAGPAHRAAAPRNTPPLNATP